MRQSRKGSGVRDRGSVPNRAGRKWVPVLISICLGCSPLIRPEGQSRTLELKNLAPRSGDVVGWAPDGEAQFAAGEDLFLLIDGGAEVYLKYGFKEALFQAYISDDGKSINLEIYEMVSPEAAHGIYTFKTGDGGNPIDVGQEGKLESYYLNFRRGNFLVTIIGLDTDVGTLEGIEKIARAVDSKLAVRSK